MKVDKRTRERARRILTEARKLIANPKKWCKESEAKDEFGKPVPVTSDSAISFCAIGAVKHIANNRGATKAADIALKTLNTVANDIYSISEIWCVNDRLGHAETLKAFSLANKQLRKGE